MGSPEAGWRSTALRAEVSLAVDGAMPELPPDLEQQVASIWAAERALRLDLFNGRVFCADRITPDRITGHWTEYRRVLAQMRRPALFDRLGIRALAVNGLIECQDGLVLGRRQAGAVYLPGFWQAPPAGNVEMRNGASAIDLAGQLLAELHEELGLEPAEARDVRAVAAIEHAETHVVDAGFLLRTPLSFKAVEARRVLAGNQEYDALRVVAPDDVPRLLAGADPMLLPSARILMHCWNDGDRARPVRRPRRTGPRSPRKRRAGPGGSAR